jgi:hypothetical protein
MGFCFAGDSGNYASSESRVNSLQQRRHTASVTETEQLRNVINTYCGNVIGHTSWGQNSEFFHVRVTLGSIYSYHRI